MKLLFLMIEDFDFESRSHLFSDLALEFGRRGHDTTVVVPTSRSDLAPWRLSEESGVRVLRVFVPSLFNVGFIAKGIANLKLPWKVSRALDQALGREEFDLLVYHTPPIFYASLVRRFKRSGAVKTYLILRDIFPQNAVDLGIMRKGPLFAWFRRIEKRLYAMSDRMGCMSLGNIRYLLEHNKLDPKRLELLPNWKKVRPEGADPEPGKRLIRDWGLEGKYVAVFGGVLGISQDLDFVLDYAKTVMHLKDVVFLIIGEGNRKAHLQERVRSEGIANVMIKDKILRSQFDSLLLHCQVGLVNLAKFFTIPNIPSKILDYFDAGIPVLAAVDPNTDYGTIVEGSGGGFWCLNGDLAAYDRIFMRLYENAALRGEMGRAGKRYLVEHLGVEKAADTILSGAVI